MCWEAAATGVEQGAPPLLLIIWHSRTGASEALARAALAGAQSEAASPPAQLVAAADAGPDVLLAASGYIFAFPENLGTMSGAMKDLFDRCYYPLLGRIEGRPYASLIAAGSDGQGAQAQLDRIVTGWRLRRVADPVIVNLAAQTPEAILAPKQLPEAARIRACELGQALAAGLQLGVF